MFGKKAGKSRRPPVVASLGRLEELCEEKEEDGTLKISWEKLPSLKNTAYAGLVVQRAPFATEEIDLALEALDPLYVYDSIQPMGLGTALTRTKVRRCLVGEPGSTYKYLGLRMFAYPWTYNASTKVLHRLNAHLREEALRLDPEKAKADFSVTLINCMDHEPDFFSELSVSWHADSCLEHASTIAVYQRLLKEDKKAKEGKKPWQLRLRLRIDAEGPRRGTPHKDSLTIPDISIALNASALCYWMLNDFNHHHQHAIQAGSVGTRISSTHRVARREGHTADWCLTMGRDTMVKSNWTNVARALDTIEFEWLRQWFIQGSAHARRLASSWRTIIDEMTQLWIAFECLEFSRIRTLIDASSTNQLTNRRARKSFSRVIARGGIKAYDAAIADIDARRKKRCLWAERERDPDFWHAAASSFATSRKKKTKVLNFSDDERPIINESSDDAFLIPGRLFLQARHNATDNRLPYNGLDSILRDLRAARAAFLSQEHLSPGVSNASVLHTTRSSSNSISEQNDAAAPALEKIAYPSSNPLATSTVKKKRRKRKKNT